MLLNSSSDSRYFSRVLNLYFSLLCNCEKNCKLRVWDLGMTQLQAAILNKLKIEVIKIPEFVSYWNLCYTWKPYIYKYTDELNFFYLDAGCTVNNDISEIFNLIETDGYFFVNQGQKLKDVIPPNFNELIVLNKENENSLVFAAGIIGINKKLEINKEIIDVIFDLAKKGYCLGYSKNEIHRDLTKLNIIRNCSKFRHDQSVVNAIFRSYLDEIIVHDANIYASTTLTSDCIIYNQRKLNYKYFYKKVSLIKILLYIYCIFLDKYNLIKSYFVKYIKNNLFC